MSDSVLKLTNQKLLINNRHLNKIIKFTTTIPTTNAITTKINKRTTKINLHDDPTQLMQHDKTILATTTNRILPTKNVYSNQTVPHGFLVYGDGCRIPDLNPLASDVMKLFHKEGYKECSKRKPLTKIVHNFTTNSVYLIRDENAKKDYDSELYCCYQEITRDGEGEKADSQFQ